MMDKLSMYLTLAVLATAGVFSYTLFQSWQDSEDFKYEARALEERTVDYVNSPPPPRLTYHPDMIERGVTGAR